VKQRQDHVGIEKVTHRTPDYLKAPDSSGSRLRPEVLRCRSL
jgi:hypothetical protein